MTTTAAEMQLHLILRDVCGVRTMDVIETLKPFLTTYAEQVRPQWRTIESAPRDGTDVLLWIDTDADPGESTGGQYQAYAISGFHSARAWRTQFHVTVNPTHWMPALPTPPSPQSSGTASEGME